MSGSDRLRAHVKEQQRLDVLRAEHAKQCDENYLSDAFQTCALSTAVAGAGLFAAHKVIPAVTRVDFRLKALLVSAVAISSFATGGHLSAVKCSRARPFAYAPASQSQ
jgi:hypothetical protein